MTVLFISDLHLDPSRPAAIRQFLDFLEHEARDAQSLYILGDLFEAWIGDDDDDPGLSPIVRAIAGLTSTGVSCHFMHGNRDFLVGERFAATTGVTLLEDFAVVDTPDGPLLLTHGDLLCTDDSRYMTLRAQLRAPDWQREFLGKSLAERRAIAAGLRELSRNEMAAKSESIMDVSQNTVAATMRRFGVRQMLHGHTHRPAVHRFDLDGEAAVRVVLGDWYGSGSYVAWTGEGPRAIALTL